MQTRTNLRIPRRALAQWERVKVKLTEQIEARGQVADGPTIFCEACALLDAATGGTGIIAEEGAPFYEAPVPADDRLDLARALAGRRELRKSPRRKADDRLDLAAELRNIATRLEVGDLAIEVAAED